MFAELFDPVIDGRHNGFKKNDKHKTDLDAGKIMGGELDSNYVLSSRVSALDAYNTKSYTTELFNSALSWVGHCRYIYFYFVAACLCCVSNIFFLSWYF